MTQQQPSLYRNPLTLAGVWIAALAGVAFVTYYVIEEIGLLVSPYSGLFGFILVPAVLVFGLLLIPIGVWRERRRRAKGRQAWRWPLIDLDRRRTRNVLLSVAVLGLVNVGLVTVAGMGAIHYMETDRFCGQVCHTPMQPEFTAHLRPPHASVGCVQCHVAPGTTGTIRAKLNGTRQLFRFVLGTYERPIPTPARGLPVAADTCWQCHSAGFPDRDIAVTKREYADDEESTMSEVTLVMHAARTHWHARPTTFVEYVAADPKRETIPYVKVTAADGTVTEFFAEGTTERPSGASRRMDCLDCHSRPAHAFSASPEQAVDHALAAGHVSLEIPFIRRELVAALAAANGGDDADGVDGAGGTSSSSVEPEAAIRGHLSRFYQDNDPALGARVREAADVAVRLYGTNVFPKMGVTWGTHVTQLGHTVTPGCFRCHDGSHATKDGRVISQECDLCHEIKFE